MFADTDRPRLARGARLQWDAVGERNLLLVPEGALALNDTAAAVLRLCDGARTVEAIVSELESRYVAEEREVTGGVEVDGRGMRLRDDVVQLLERIAERGFVVNADA